MTGRSRRRVAALALLMTACAREASPTADVAIEPVPVAATDAPTTTTTAAPTTSTTVPAPTTTTTTAPVPARVGREQAWTPFATVGPVTLHHPADRVEAIGFHQSAQDGAQALLASSSAVRWFAMDTRRRDTDRQGAADIVVEPGREIRSPVTGTVLRAGRYTLYCDHVDEFAIIEPDARPGWEVKVLHVEGLALVTGQRVEAGVTRLAAHARVLPFPSQVERDTGDPAWPHVHIEVIDPTVPDRPTGPGCP